jgi:hypothetical protein
MTLVLSAGGHAAGSSLLLTLIVQAERDCPILVNTCSDTARSFYLRNGFAELAQQPVLIGKRPHWWLALPARRGDVPIR